MGLAFAHTAREWARTQNPGAGFLNYALFVRVPDSANAARDLVIALFVMDLDGETTNLKLTHYPSLRQPAFRSLHLP